MAVYSAVEATDYLSRDGSFLDPAADWTITRWGKLFLPDPASFRSLVDLFAPAAAQYIYLGNFTSGLRNFGVEVWDGTTLVDTGTTTIASETWTYFATTYTVATTTLTFSANNVLISSVSADLSAMLPMTQDVLFNDGGTNDAASYERSWQAALTPAELLLESRSPFAVRMTNLLSDCPLVVPGNLADQSGNGHDWHLNGTITYVDGPLTPNVFPTKKYPPRASDTHVQGKISDAWDRYHQSVADQAANAAQVSGPTGAGHVAVWIGDKQLADGGMFVPGITPLDLSAALDALP